MTILLLENRGAPGLQLQALLEKKDYHVLLAVTIDDANSFWEGGNIDCLIVDLHMPPDGLTKAEIEQMEKIMKDTILPGWIWLQNYVFKAKPEMRMRTIIYSGYLEQLRRYVSDEKLKGIYLVPKGDSESPNSTILAHLKTIATRIGSGGHR